MFFNSKNKSKLKPRTLWVLVLVFFLIGLGLIWLINKTNNPNVLLVFAVISFLALSICLQLAMARTFGYKPKAPKKIVKKFSISDFSILEDNLKKELFTKREASFGKIYSKIVKETFYKVTLINNSDKYFNNDTVETLKPTKGIEKCTKMIGIEIFEELNDQVVNKTPDFSVQTEKLLYEGFYFDKEIKQIIQPNILPILEDHRIDYEKLLNILGLTSIVGDIDEI